MIVLPLEEAMYPEIWQMTNEWFGYQPYKDFLDKFKRIAQDGACVIESPRIIAYISIGNIQEPFYAEIHQMKKRGVNLKIDQMKQIFKKTIMLLFERHNIARMIGATPTYMIWAIRTAKLCGMRQFGTFWGYDVMSNRWVDHVLTSIHREDILCQQQ